MGCDIHFYTETLEEGADKWQSHYRWLFDEEPPFDLIPADWAQTALVRNYELFGLLAGVRVDNIHARDRRGIPKDCDPRIYKYYQSWKEDAHSPSWITMKELKEELLRTTLLPEGKGKKSLLFGLKDAYDIMEKLLSKTDNDPEKIRAIFWFDN